MCRNRTVKLLISIMYLILNKTQYIKIKIYNYGLKLNGVLNIYDKTHDVTHDAYYRNTYVGITSYMIYTIVYYSSIVN